MDWLAGYVLAFTALAIAMVSPGPDFLIVLKNSLAHGRRAGIVTALGVASAISIHVAYCITGLALIISQSILLFNTLKWCGAGYILYLAYKCFRSNGWGAFNADAASHGISDRAAFRQGFMTNLLNPKATLFFLAFFTQIIAPHTPVAQQMTYGVMAVAMAAAWFSTVSTVLTVPRLRQHFLGMGKTIDRLTGVAFTALAFKLLVARPQN